jgi:hypothetical protein
MSYASFTNGPASTKFPAHSVDLGTAVPARVGRGRLAALLVLASPGILNFYSDPAWSDSNAGLLFASGAQNGTMSLDAISFTVSAATPTPSPSPSLTPSPSPSPSSSPTSTPVPIVTSFSGTSGSRFYVDGHLFSVVNPDQPYNLTNPDSQTLRFEVHSQEYWVTSGFSDLTNDGGAERSEIEGVSDFPVDADVHLTYEFMMESGGVNTAQWMVIGQLWSVCCSPPFAVEMRGEHMAINVRWSTDKTEHVVYLDPNPIQRDRYYTMDIRVNYAKGTAVVFRDGVQILNYQGPLGYGGSSHWEYGLYRAPTTNDIQAARYRNLVISP